MSPILRPSPRFPGVLALTLITLGHFCGEAEGAEQVSLAEPPGDQRILSVEISLASDGKVATTTSGDEKDELPMRAEADFQFHERRLPPGGRDAEAFRALRAFSQASLKTVVSEHTTDITLPSRRNVIVSNGTREGAISYSPEGNLTREESDLLEIPGDPLTLLGMLPPQPVELAEEWTPPDWALQMLTGIEAVESSQCKCRFDQSTPHAAKITFTGKIEGLKLGAKTTVEVAGAIIFDREENLLSQAKTIFRVKASVGVVNPGLSMSVTSVVRRRPTTESTPLDKYAMEDIPLEAPEEALTLAFDAEPWGLHLDHSRDWHLFHAIFDGQAPVAILRLMNLGSLVAQCNLSPIADAAPGGTIPLDQFESDIQQSLGKRFGKFLDREQIPATDGRQIYRVMVEGQVEVGGNKGSATIPMNWIYYLAAGPNGKQVSFVFSVEPSLVEQLGTQDRQIVESLKFRSTNTASRR